MRNRVIVIREEEERREEKSVSVPPNREHIMRTRMYIHSHCSLRLSIVARCCHIAPEITIISYFVAGDPNVLLHVIFSVH